MEPLVITKIEKQKRQPHRYNVFINGEYTFSVHEDLMIKYRLLKGTTIDREDLEQLLGEEERQKAYLTAIRFLSVRSRSVKEVTARLKRDGHEPELIDSVISRLTSEQLLNDAAFAELTAVERLHVQKKGRLWIRQELKQKGVLDRHIRETIDGIDPETELSEARAIAEKRWRQTSGEPADRKRKLIAFLLRRGYPSGTVHQVLRQLNLDSGEFEFDDMLE
jgi:regulatory protein